MDSVYNLVESIHFFIPIAAVIVFLSILYINSRPSYDESETTQKQPENEEKSQKLSKLSNKKSD